MKLKNYFIAVESDVLEECNDLIHNVPLTNQASTHKRINSYEYYTVYFHCPICLNSGFKTIQHIKVCASKNLISPKDVVCLLRQCPKTQRQKFNSRNTKSSRHKQGGANKEKVDKLCELLIYDEQFKQELVQKRVSKLLMAENLAYKMVTADLQESLPHSWKL